MSNQDNVLCKCFDDKQEWFGTIQGVVLVLHKYFGSIQCVVLVLHKDFGNTCVGFGKIERGFGTKDWGFGGSSTKKVLYRVFGTVQIGLGITSMQQTTKFGTAQGLWFFTG